MSQYARLNYEIYPHTSHTRLCHQLPALFPFTQAHPTTLFQPSRSFLIISHLIPYAPPHGLYPLNQIAPVAEWLTHVSTIRQRSDVAPERIASLGSWYLGADLRRSLLDIPLGVPSLVVGRFGSFSYVLF
jgi:hypothetical protein